MAEEKGFIKLNRRIADNWLWNNEKFSKGQAWIDLLLMAQYKDGCFCGKRGRIDYKRGDCTFSLSDLAKRWGWSRSKVRFFLSVLEKQEMIKRKIVKNTYSIITVLNYDKYQGKEKNKKDEDFDYEKARAFLMGDEEDE